MRYVKYVGLAQQRQITAHDWRSVGINGETVVWSAFNGFAVPLDQFSDDQIRKAIEPDSGFVITGDDEEFTPAPQTRDMTPQQVEDVTKAPVDVVEYANTGERPSTGLSEASGGAPVARTTPDADGSEK